MAIQLKNISFIEKSLIMLGVYIYITILSYYWAFLNLWTEDFTKTITSCPLEGNSIHTLLSTLNTVVFFSWLLSFIALFDLFFKIISMFGSKRNQKITKKITKKIIYPYCKNNRLIFLQRVAITSSLIVITYCVFLFFGQFIPYLEHLLESAAITTELSEYYIEHITYFFVFSLFVCWYISFRLISKIKP